MANPRLDPVHASEFYMANMLQWSRLLTNVAMPPRTPHLVSHPINFHVGAIGSQIGANTSFDRHDPDHINTITDQLQALVDHQLIDDQGREVKVFDPLGNVCLELLAESVGVGVVLGSGELSLENSVHGSDQGETFTFGNDGLD